MTQEKREEKQFCSSSLGVKAKVHGPPGGAAVRNTPANSGDTCSISGSRRSPGEGNGNPFQHSCLENRRDRGAWGRMVHRIMKE